MTEPNDDALVAELRDLARRLDVPPAPDLRAAVRAQILAHPRSRWRRWRTLLAGIVAVILVAAVPPARAAVADVVTKVFTFAGVEVHLRPGPIPVTPTPSPLPSQSPLPSLHSAALDEARRRARFPVGVPDRLGVPQDVQLADPTPDGAPRVVSLLYQGGTVRLDEFDGQWDVTFSKGDPDRDARWVSVHDQFAIWFPTPHPMAYVDREGTHQLARTAGPTLIWQNGETTYRLEGIPSLDEAIRVAESVH
jgi:hypothetical protein